MERGLASQLQAFFKATVLGLAILSMATWAPHMYVFLRNLFLVSIPSAVSAIVTPRCLFVFSNIIVVFLANESKLTRSNTQSMSMESYTDVARHLPVAWTPVDKEVHGELATEEMAVVEEEEEGSMGVVHESLPQLDQCDQLEATSTIIAADKKLLTEDVLVSDVSVANSGDGDECMEEEEHLRQRRIELGEDVIDEEECEEEEEEMGLPTDELNRRVEDFIARFNMERQLEARMLVCCF